MQAIDPTGAPLDAGQTALVTAIAMLGGGSVAGVLGQNVTGAATAAENEALNNATKHPGQVLDKSAMTPQEKEQYEDTRSVGVQQIQASGEEEEESGGVVLKGGAPLPGGGNAAQSVGVDMGTGSDDWSNGVAPNSVGTPHGLAVQSTTPESLAALQQVQNGATLYRAGTLGIQNTADAQFWSFENPLANPNYASQMGMPGSNAPTFDWVMTGTLAPGANVITRPAPGLGVNAGGQIEAVVVPGSVNIKSFHMPSK